MPIVSWVGLELADSISNAMEMGGVAGKYEKDRAKESAVYFLFVVMA
jgi:hypothetical protein